MSDLIKREDAIKAFEDVLDCDFSHVSEETPRERIEAIPSADRPRGEWIEQEDDYHHYWECSECGMGVGLDDIRNFCPNCGAKMKGADDE